MPELPPELYLPIAGVLCTVIGVLRVRELALTQALIQDSDLLEGIKEQLGKMDSHNDQVIKALSLVTERLEALHESMPRSPRSSGGKT